MQSSRNTGCDLLKNFQCEAGVEYSMMISKVLGSGNGGKVSRVMRVHCKKIWQKFIPDWMESAGGKRFALRFSTALSEAASEVIRRMQCARLVSS